jgi:enolase
MFVKGVSVRLIKNSRKEKSIEVELKTLEGKFTASPPSGKSTGKHEVPAYNLKGVGRSFKMMKAFCSRLKNKNFLIKKIEDLKLLREEIGRFEKKFGRFGGNATYVLETVFLKGAAADKGLELWEFINEEVNNGLRPKIPMPVGNCIGGGLHSRLIGGKRPDFQEFLLIPRERTFARAVSVNLRAYGYARKLLKASKKDDENAWMTPKTNEEVLDILKEVGKKYKLRIGLDIAASTFYSKGYYNYENKSLIRDKVDQADYVERLAKNYNLFYVEDGMQEEDFGGFGEILAALKKAHKKTLIVGDDLTTTNLSRVRRAISGKSMNAMIVKPNQIGSLIEVKKVIEICKRNNIKTIFSHRAGETMDDSLADLAVGFGADFIKCGIFGRERLIKMKRIMDIEKEINK